MYKNFIVLACFFLSQFVVAQNEYQNPIPKLERRPAVEYKATFDTIAIDTLFLKKSVAPTPVLTYWTKKNNLGVDLSQVAFVNWNAGGNNAISGLVKTAFNRKYQKKLLLWDNELIAKYGLSKQQETELRKTDDQLKINSTFGYRSDSLSNWYYSVKFNFNTQFTSGFKYPDTSSPISRFMAPGYLFLGAGAEYAPNKKFNLFMSPITQKSTFVLDQELANSGSFGVTKAVLDVNGNIIEEGQNVRTEVGILITNFWETGIYKNMTLISRSTLYSDYLNNFGNIDVDWEVLISFVVNEYVKASLGTQILYDDDVKFKEDTDGDGTLETFGARIQFKQILGIGFSYEF